MKLILTLLASAASVAAFGGTSGDFASSAGSDGEVHYHRLADGSLLKHNFACEPDTTCLYPGQTTSQSALMDMAKHEEVLKASQAALVNLRGNLQGAELNDLNAALSAMGLTGTETFSQYLGSPELATYFPNAGMMVGRRQQTRGGGGGYPPAPPGTIYCPSGSYWGNPGPYCLGDDIYYCQSPGQTNPPLQTTCSNGCTHAPPGTPDQCNAGGGSGRCYNNNDCIYGYYCANNGQCTPNQAPQCSNNANCASGYCCVSQRCQPCNSGGSGGNPQSHFGQPWYDYAVKGHNDRILQYIRSSTECAERCVNERSFYCASYEYAPASQQCVLAKSTYPTVPAPGWILYFRTS